jgi:MFS family permease
MKLGGGFWRLWLATGSSNLADGMGRTAFPLLAVTLTRDPFQISMLTAAFFLPWLVFSLPSGALVDRVDRSRAMAIANAIRGAVLAVLAVGVITGLASMPLLYLAALSLGAAETVADNAYRAVLPSVVRKDELDRANGYLQGTELVADGFLGAPLASLSFAAATWSPFVASAVSFGVGAAAARSLPPTPPDRSAALGNEVRSMRLEIAEGIRWLASHPLLRSVMLMAAAMGFVGSGYNAVMVLYALDVLGIPEALFGVFILTLAVGGVAGSLTASAVSVRLGRANALRLSVALGGLMFAALAFVRDPIVAAVVFAASAWSVLLWNVLSMSLRQQLIPEALFGRVQGAWRMVVYGAMPLGALLGGLVASRFGLSAPFLVAGLGHALVLLAGWSLLRRADQAAATDSTPG